MHEEIMVLTQKARKNGGDKYETKDKSWAVYLPQKISRAGGAEPALAIKLTIDRVEG